ncbi:MAG: hypothetical protein WAL95_13030 [Candidatus Acidiferrales bacterium]
MTSTQIQTSKLNDPLLHGFEMPLEATYYPLGFPLQITTNCTDILSAADDSWGRFREIYSQPALQMRIGVLEGGPSECPGDPVYRSQRSLQARIADPENFSVSDIRTGFAYAWLTRATVQNRAYLRWHFIEGMTWDLLGPYITPVHAGCVRFAGRGVLMCGDSGAGKSSLTYACARRGWTFMSDDSSNLVRGREGAVVVGNPYQIRFRESALELFPELRTRPLTAKFTGGLAIELATSGLPEIETTLESSVDYIVFLNRSLGGPARLVSFSKEAALQWFEQVIFCAEKDFVDAQKASLRNLLSAQVFELRYNDLTSAIERLESLIQNGR